jgi:hypothetical protein
MTCSVPAQPVRPAQGEKWYRHRLTAADCGAHERLHSGLLPAPRRIRALDPVRRRRRAAEYCSAFNDTIRFRHAGIPAVTFGPGEDGWAVYDESISVDAMVLAVAVLERAVRTFLSTTELASP